MATSPTGIGHLLAAADVPGIAGAVIRDGRLESFLCDGVRDVRAPAPVDQDTIFDAASLITPVFAHAVLQLPEQGALFLDALLTDYLPGDIPADERASSITARHVLDRNRFTFVHRFRSSSLC